jgi:hypothetical protein
MRRAAAALATLLALPACAHAHGRGSISGDGNPTTQPRDVAPFEEIELDTHADVNVRVGGERSVSVTIDGNLQPHLLTVVRGRTLVIESEESLRPRSGVRVEVTVPALRKLVISGSGDVAVEGGSGPLELGIEGSGELRWKGEATELRASIDGSGDLRLEGRADRLQVSVSGSGDVDAAQLRAKDVEASIEGSGNIGVNVDGGSLTAKVSGSGDIRWRGEAKVERVSVSGSGEIRKGD